MKTRADGCKVENVRVGVMRPILHMLSLMVLSTFCASGMDRLDALSQIESRDNDRAVGSHHEVSRYQILPAFWPRAWASSLLKKDDFPNHAETDSKTCAPYRLPSTLITIGMAAFGRVSAYYLSDIAGRALQANGK